jgi:prevent-host-death family protein
MNVVTVRELRNHGGEVLTRVAGGESVLITRDGAEVAELRPLRRRAVPTVELIARRACLPLMDGVSLRADLDDILDSSL